MKIGIPRGLFYFYYYYPFWKAMFETLGYEVVVSDETTEKTLSDGASITASELCEPIKIFNGHVVNLVEKNVDYIFIPYFYSHGNEWYCSKLASLPELAKCSALDINKKAITVKFTSKTDALDEIYDYLPLCQQLDVQRMFLRRAVTAGMKAQEEFREICTKGYTAPEAFRIMEGEDIPLPRKNSDVCTVALMGYPDCIYDRCIGHGILEKLRNMGFNVVTFDMIKEKLIEKKKRHTKDNFWVFARKIYYGSKYYLMDREIDGIVHVSTYPCEQSAEISGLISDMSKETQRPFLSLPVGINRDEDKMYSQLEDFSKKVIYFHQHKDELWVDEEK